MVGLMSFIGPLIVVSMIAWVLVFEFKALLIEIGWQFLGAVQGVDAQDSAWGAKLGILHKWAPLCKSVVLCEENLINYRLRRRGRLQ